MGISRILPDTVTHKTSSDHLVSSTPHVPAMLNNVKTQSYLNRQTDYNTQTDISLLGQIDSSDILSETRNKRRLETSPTSEYLEEKCSWIVFICLLI